MKFTDLDLDSRLLSAIAAQNFTECTPIQESAMPHILAGRDVAGLAQTGTGKTAAFAIPLMDRILKTREAKPESKTAPFKDWNQASYILVLVPTRELAEQLRDNIVKLGKEAGLSAGAIYGGASYEKQKAAINRGVEFVVATPGRLIDLFKEHVIDLHQVKAVVFDEADRMFDMGFKDDMIYILKRIPRDRQFLVFSATLNFDVLNTAYEFGANPVDVNVSKDQAKAENVQDEIFHVGYQEKPRYLLSILKKVQPRQAIVFSNYKHNIDRLARFLTSNGVPAVGISSLLTQAQRNRVMASFRSGGENNILVATDVAARGLDIKGVDIVVNYELPDDPENYVHRIGRTGRAGESGVARSFVCDRDVDALMRIESYLGHKVAVGWLPDEELVKDIKPFFEGRPRSDRMRPPREGSRGGEGRHQDRPRRDGPRRDGPRRDGPRRDGPPREGSRREGPRREGPPREGQHRGGPPREGQRRNAPQGGAPHRRDQPHWRGERGEGRPQRSSQRDQSNRPLPQGGRRYDHRQRPQGIRHRPSGAGPRPGAVQASAPRSAGGAGVGQKISAFFKKIFGQ